MLLDFHYFVKVKSRGVRLVIHLEVLDLFKTVLRLPAHAFLLLFVCLW